MYNFTENNLSFSQFQFIVKLFRVWQICDCVSYEKFVVKWRHDNDVASFVGWRNHQSKVKKLIFFVHVKEAMVKVKYSHPIKFCQGFYQLAGFAFLLFTHSIAEGSKLSQLQFWSSDLTKLFKKILSLKKSLYSCYILFKKLSSFNNKLNYEKIPHSI